MSEKFKTAYSKKERVIQENGNKIQDIYGYIINDKGMKELGKTGEKNIYEEIQEQLEETKIENILKKVSVGDMSDFRPDGIYEDISEVPNNLIQAKREMQKIENLWKDLPNEIKKEYDWSVEQFMAEAGTENWLINTGMIQPIIEKSDETKEKKPKKESKSEQAPQTD